VAVGVSSGGGGSELWRGRVAGLAATTCFWCGEGDRIGAGVESAAIRLGRRLAASDRTPARLTS
jgi:hypothetical protein